MAIDTRNKRASALSMLTPWFPVPPVPDGEIDDGDRQQVAGVYRGIAAAEQTGEPRGVVLRKRALAVAVLMRRRRRGRR